MKFVKEKSFSSCSSSEDDWEFEIVDVQNINAPDHL